MMKIESCEPETNKKGVKKIEKNFHCQICEISFVRNHELKSHVRKKHPKEEKTECPICKAIFGKSRLKIHLKTVHEGQKDYKCDLCENEYFEKKRLKEHVKRDHDKIRGEKCNQCVKQFFTKEVLTRHIRNIHNKDQNQKVHNEQIAKLFECEFCGKSFTKKIYMNKHLKNVHKGSRDYVCHICAKAFADKSNLVQHLLYVHGKKNKKEKKFQCAICDYIATCDWNLNDHVKRVHHKIKEHCCDKCGKRFSSVQYLKKHDFKNHGGVNGGRIWYKCDLCKKGKAFRGPGILEKHLRLIHKMEGPLNIKPEGFDEKMEKQAKKCLKNQEAKKFCQQWISSMPPKDKDIDENLEKKIAENLPSLEDTTLCAPPSAASLSFGMLESSVTPTDTNGKPILGELNYIPMKNYEDEDYQNNQDKQSYSSSSYQNEENHEQPPETEDEDNHEQPPEINSNESRLATPVLEKMGVKLELEAKNEVIKKHLIHDDTSAQKCKHCDKSYVGPNSLNSLKLHMKSHLGYHHRCHICDKDFLHKLGRLIWHMQTKHKCENICEKCGKAFTSKEFLKTHFDGKHYDERIKTRDDGIFECNICNRELKSYGHAERHMKLLHPSEGSKFLNFEDSKDKDVNTGEYTHEDLSDDGLVPRDTRNLKCEKTKIPLKTVHEGIKNFKCNQCGKKYFENKGLKNHIKRKHDNIRDEKCNQCSKLFFSKEVLNRHIKNMHKHISCHLCNGEFLTKSNLVEHMKMEHPKEHDVVKDRVHKVVKKHIKSVQEKLYCEKCGTTVTDIKRHLEQVHEGRKKFKCENCGKEYTEKKGLLVHIKRIHDNIRDEQCNQCGKLFFTKEVLKGHIRNIHNKDQNPRLKCEYCQKSYTQKSYFKLHQRTIHGI